MTDRAELRGTQQPVHHQEFHQQEATHEVPQSTYTNVLYRQRLSDDVEVELCFSSSPVKERANVPSLLPEILLDSGDKSNGDVLSIDLSNFSGRVYLHRVVSCATAAMDTSDFNETQASQPLSQRQQASRPLATPHESILSSTSLRMEQVQEEEDDEQERGATAIEQHLGHDFLESGLDRRRSTWQQQPPPPQPQQQQQQQQEPVGWTTAGGMVENRRGRRNLYRSSAMPPPLSMRDVTQMGDLMVDLSSVADENGAVEVVPEIFRAVASPDLTVRRFEEALDRDGPDAAKSVDGKGRLPLHILGSNSDLISDPDGQVVAKQCAIALMQLYPEGIVQEDEDGRMPFTFLVYKWVDWTHQEGEVNSRTSQNSPHNRSVQESARAKLQKLLTPNQFFASDATANTTHPFISSIKSRESSLYESSNRFPPVVIFEEVEWCFEMLSIAMDHLGGKPLEGTQQVRPLLSHGKQKKDRFMLAENVASIPQLLKTTMLLESNETRNKILDSSVIRRSLLCVQSVGPWLTSMLRYKKGAASGVSVDFLRTLSTLSVEDFTGDYRTVLPRDEEEFHEAKLAIFKSVERLRDLIPSLLVLPDDLWDQALSTPIIWFCTNQQVTTPFAVGIATTDFQLNITTIMAVRQLAFGQIAADGYSDVFPFLSIITLVFFTCLYSVIRQLCQMYALYRISSKVAWRYWLDPWHLLDFIAVFAAMLASAHYSTLVEAGKSKEDLAAPVALYAIMLGLLWLRVLGFLKAINESLATFIVALGRIFIDIRFFCVVLFVVVIMFGDMFHLVFVRDSCNTDELNSLTEDPVTEDFCSERPLDSYLRVYSIVIGDFDLSDFQQNRTITILWFFVTFIGLVVMLNTLIAVITFSYEGSHSSSKILFRKVRCELVAGNAAFEGFLRPRFFFSSSAQWNINCTFLCVAGVRWILILTFVATFSMSSTYIISRLIEAINDKQVISFIALGFVGLDMVFAIFFCIGLIMRLCCRKEAGKPRVQRIFDSIEKWIVEVIAMYMFGVELNGDGGDPIPLSPGGNDDVLVKLSQLEKTLANFMEQQQKSQTDAPEGAGGVSSCLQRADIPGFLKTMTSDG